MDGPPACAKVNAPGISCAQVHGSEGRDGRDHVVSHDFKCGNVIGALDSAKDRIHAHFGERVLLPDESIGVLAVPGDRGGRRRQHCRIAKRRGSDECQQLDVFSVGGNPGNGGVTPVRAASASFVPM